MRRRGGSEYEGLKPMDRDELDAFRKHLASLDPYPVLNVYREAWYGCRPGDAGLPNGRAVQELVQAWRELQRLQNRRRAAPRA